MASREYSTSATAYASSGGNRNGMGHRRRLSGRAARCAERKHVVISRRGFVFAIFGPERVRENTGFRTERVGPNDGKTLIARDASTGTMSTRRAACVLARVCEHVRARFRHRDERRLFERCRASPPPAILPGVRSGGAERRVHPPARTPARAFAAASPTGRARRCTAALDCRARTASRSAG